MPSHITTTADRAVIAKYLVEALGKEEQLVTALRAQIVVAQRPGLVHALEEHLVVTQRQVSAIRLRLDDLGHTNADSLGVSPIGLASSAVGLAVTLANKGLSLAKGPLVAFRGTSKADRELRIVRDCYWNEAEEIAHYRVIETVAEQLGDEVTAALAREHRLEEEQMQTTLEGQLPAVVRTVVVAETPAHEWAKPKPTPRPAARTARPKAAARAS